MEELRRLKFLLDNSNIQITPRYIKSATYTWADKLGRHLDNDDWQLDPTLFLEIDIQFGPHTIDRLVSALHTLLPRYNARWPDHSCEALNELHLSDSRWRDESN
jgi:hypothetical protein